MGFYTQVNAILERITFSNKTRILIGIIAGGMVSIGFLMFISIFALKFDYETLFQSRTMPLVELEEIKDLYAVNIHDTLYDLQFKHISVANATEVISLANQIIDEQWENYQTSIKHEVGGVARFANWWLGLFLLAQEPSPKSLYQEGITSKVRTKMDAIDGRVNRILNLAKADEFHNVSDLTAETFLEINALNIYISSLIGTHLKDAISEKIRTERIFHTSIFMLIFLLGLVFFLSILVSVVLINHFKELHNSLELKVDEKTKALQELNSSTAKKTKSCSSNLA